MVSTLDQAPVLPASPVDVPKRPGRTLRGRRNVTATRAPHRTGSAKYSRLPFLIMGIAGLLLGIVEAPFRVSAFNPSGVD